MERSKKAAVLGATGPIGRGLVAELSRRGVEVRASSRSDVNLLRDFGSLGVECVGADLRDPAGATRAADGCDLLFVCAGLPLKDYAQHADIGRAVAQAMRTTGARAVLVSGSWSYGAGAPIPITEQTERNARDRRSRARLEQEQTLQGAGAAVAILPDFYGPGAHGVLNSALTSVGAGAPARWFSGLDVPREFVFVPDLFKPLVDLCEKEEAFGDRWVIAGAGGITARQIGAIARAHLGRAAEFRPTARWKVALASLADAGAREFLPVAPIYAHPAVFDDRKFRAAFGAHDVTPYERGVRATLDALAGRAAGAA